MGTDHAPTRGGRAATGLALLVTVLAVAAGVWLGAATFRDAWRAEPQSTLQQGTLLPQPRTLAPFALTDQDGRGYNNANLLGHWTFVAFGYTSCPDVCPMMLATLAAVDRALADQAEGEGTPAEVLFVSVDPERDTPERLGKYIRHFNPRFIGATGSDVQLKALAAQLGVMFARVEGEKTALGYLMDHSASILLIDPEGRFAAVFSTPHDAKKIAADFLKLKRDHTS